MRGKFFFFSFFPPFPTSQTAEGMAHGESFNAQFLREAVSPAEGDKKMVAPMTLHAAQLGRMLPFSFAPTKAAQ
jgi:hypothetical protein